MRIPSMRIPSRSVAAALTLVTAAALATSCTIDKNQGQAPVGGGTISKIDAVKGVKIKVSSKEFDEQLLLGQIAIVALQAAGADPEDKTNITGSSNVRQALTTGAVDLLLGVHRYRLDQLPQPDQADPRPEGPVRGGQEGRRREQRHLVGAVARQRHLRHRRDQKALKQHNVKDAVGVRGTVKSNPSAASTCIGPEFKSRDDGFPGLEKTYGFTLPGASEHLVNDAVIYPTVGKGDTCDFGEVASTDGRVSAQNLTVLGDDKHFFPIYNPAITIRTQLATQYPQARAGVRRHRRQARHGDAHRADKKVSVEGQKSNTVAHDWLKSAGFIG